jgi:hypothetical protein
MRHEDAVATPAHVDFEDVRTVLDRGCERVEAVFQGSGAVAAMRDAQRPGDAERLGVDAAQRSDAQGCSLATSTSW